MARRLEAPHRAMRSARRHPEISGPRPKLRRLRLSSGAPAMIMLIAVGSTALIFFLFVALIRQDVERHVRRMRRLRDSKPTYFYPPGQGYQPIQSGPPGPPPKGGSVAVMGRLTPDRPPSAGAPFRCRYCGATGSREPAKAAARRLLRRRSSRRPFRRTAWCDAAFRPSIW